jgi:hypothetical protein
MHFSVHDSRLNHLIFHDCDSIDAVAFADGLDESPLLSYLDLGDNDINDEGALALSHSVAVLPIVFYFRLQGNPISLEAEEEILKLVPFVILCDRSTPAPSPPWSGCNDNTCQYAFDGSCDDGGPGSNFNICSYGTDCFDCCAKVPGRYECNGDTPPPCNDNTCQYAFDYVCDDGGPGSDYSICSYGTDCSDCCVKAPSRDECQD